MSTVLSSKVVLLYQESQSQLVIKRPLDVPNLFVELYQSDFMLLIFAIDLL